MIEAKRYMSTIRTLEELSRQNLSEKEINEKISFFDMKLSDITFEELMSLNYRKIKGDGDTPFSIYIFNKIKYVYFNPELKRPKKIPPEFGKPPFERTEEAIFFKLRPKPLEILLVDETNVEEFKYFWMIVLFVIDILLIWFFLFTRNKLKPLLSLKNEMINLSKGKFDISTKVVGKDEISQVIHEFNNALKQLKELRDSRNLFLRNIMHELKTPITKGKLITDFYEDDENKFILIRVFQRLEYLLSEFSKIEELTSGKIVLNKKTFYIIELVEQALDILLIEDNMIEIENNMDLKIDADFELFSIALKNLIDNAIKYTNEEIPKIIIENDSIKVINKGKKLTKEIEEYYKAFNHEYETADSGLGLGLYISNNIIKIHDYKLQYEYINGYHNFYIKIRP